jgi:hypothetical protein
MIGGNTTLAVLSLPVLIGGILVCELQSGVALDSWWRAEHERGTGQYSILVTWHAFGMIMLCVLAWLFWSAD